MRLQDWEWRTVAFRICTQLCTGSTLQMGGIVVRMVLKRPTLTDSENSPYKVSKCIISILDYTMGALWSTGEDRLVGERKEGVAEKKQVYP